MKKLTVLFALALFCIASSTCMAQDSITNNNRIRRNTLIGTIRKIQTDSIKIDTTLSFELGNYLSDTLKCSNKATSVIVYVCNPSLHDDKPYSLTFTQNGILLEVFSQGLVVYRSSFEYNGITFQKILSTIDLQQIVRVSPYGEKNTEAKSITFSVYYNEECFFTANDNSGILNVKGNFHPLVNYMESLVPDLQKIIEKCDNATIDNDKKE